MKRVFMAFVWSIVFYFVGCMLAGAVAGGIAGYHHPEAASEAGRIAGIKVVQEYRPYIVFAAVSLAVLGCGAGYLPGTKSRVQQYSEW
jgi:hypothetical protein